ncbi:hypothetical protein HanHA300_Chr11g0416631 [Helianthus annuus]|nr:hypothetical protein HanHA300_Chr11g0416631 [Helianthus annuus]KAJ0518724.1 hypothetical protein HanHA89_Chr11g0440661 [Helianthus annuus]
MELDLWYTVVMFDVRRTTQNSGVVSIGEDGTLFYGQLEQIIELKYLHKYSVVLFRCKWFDTSGKRLEKKNNIVSINISREWFVGNEWYDDQQYILATQAKQVFYLQDPSRSTDNWRVVEDVHHRKLWDHPSMSIVNEMDLLHDTQSSDYNLVVDSGFDENNNDDENFIDGDGEFDADVNDEFDDYEDNEEDDLLYPSDEEVQIKDDFMVDDNVDLLYACYSSDDSD